MLVIVDTYPEIITLFNDMAGVFNIGLWEKYANGISNELPEKCKHDSSDYNFDTQVIPVITHTMENLIKLDMAHNSFVQATENICVRTKEVLGTELQADIIFYLGLCNGAGWVTRLNGKPTVLLGAEKIIELDWCSYENMTALIYHELGHIWHFGLNDISKQYSLPIVQLFCEGVAMYFEQLIVGDFRHYHQNKNGWLNWCKINKTALKSEFLRRVNENESTQDFFGDWCSYQGYSDTGYYIGCEFVKWLVKSYSFTETAKLEYDVVCKEFHNFAL